MSEAQFVGLVLAVDSLSANNLEVKAILLELLAYNASLTLEICQLRRRLANQEPSQAA